VCKCKTQIHKLPCRHQLVFNKLNDLEIPLQYYRLSCDTLETTKYNLSECIIEKTEMEEEQLDLMYYANELVKTGNKYMINKMTYRLKNSVDKVKYKWNVKNGIINPTTGGLDLAKNCYVFGKRKKRKPKKLHSKSKQNKKAEETKPKKDTSNLRIPLKLKTKNSNITSCSQ